jgi:hypothetical protein
MSGHPEVSLLAEHALELGELLELVGGWLSGHPELAGSFAACIGAPGYELSDLVADCRRFSFLLGVAETLWVEVDDDEEVPS